MRPCCRLRCRIPVQIEVRGRRDGSGDWLATMVVRRGAQASAGAQGACTRCVRVGVVSRGEASRVRDSGCHGVEEATSSGFD